MSRFSFVGRLPASKSILNRLLLVKSYFPDLEIRGDSSCDDVRVMKEAIKSLHSGQVIPVGSAGTVLRFMALRASRVPGVHRLQGHHRLFERPHAELLKILRQLGVEARLGPDFMEIEGAGWRMYGDTLLVPVDRSSQFVTSVLLNAWDLPNELFVSVGGQKVSEGYWRMSVRLAQSLGMKIDFWDSDFRVASRQKPNVKTVDTEPDLSSAFALAAVATVSGSARFLDFPENSLQPDVAFVNILKSMGVPVRQSGTALIVEQASRLNGVAVNLRQSPDLFPVLAVLCAMAEGTSDLYGAPHLIHKESNRLLRIVELLRALGREVELKEDGIVLRGEPIKPSASTLTFNCDFDHRLAFAAAVLKAADFAIQIQHPEVVKKSFPEFWSILGWTI